MGWLFIALFFLIVFIVSVFVAKKKPDESSGISGFPYIKQKTLLTDAERSFLGVLEKAVGDQFRIYAQVRLADLLSVRPGTDTSRRVSAQNRINGKHADFVLCNCRTLEIICVIELDDSSHQRANRKERDVFLEGACASAGLPLARFPVKSAYVVSEIRSEILALAGVNAEPEVLPVVRTEVEKGIPASPASVGPACPKCGSETALRIVKSGAHAGSKLWGCKSYPRCKGYIPVGT